MTLEYLDLAINHLESLTIGKQEISRYDNKLGLVLCHLIVVMIFVRIVIF